MSEVDFRNIKIAFFDLDGTIVYKDNIINPLIRQTLDQLRKNGILVCMATGRANLEIPEFNVDFDVRMTFNGGCCFNEKEIIYGLTVDKNEIMQVVKNASEINRPTVVAGMNHIVANFVDDDIMEYVGFSKLNLQASDNFYDVIENEDIYELMVSCLKSDHEQFIKDTKNLKVTDWWDRAVDIIPLQSGKGKGVSEILKYYGLSKDEAIAFGDGNNDIELLQACGTAVAMGNASERLKAIATHICGDCKDDGVYYFCKEKGLI